MSHKTVLPMVIGVAVFALMSPVGLVEGHRPSAYITVQPVHTGETYVRSLRFFRTPIPGRVQSMPLYRVAIMPFADFSMQQPFIRALEWGGNRLIIETLTDHFLTHGIGVALQDDLN